MSVVEEVSSVSQNNGCFIVVINWLSFSTDIFSRMIVGYHIHITVVIPALLSFLYHS